jgi:hypothetical protein
MQSRDSNPCGRSFRYRSGEGDAQNSVDHVRFNILILEDEISWLIEGFDKLC